LTINGLSLPRIMKKPVWIKIIFPFCLSILFISQLLLQAGCANIIPPEGGLKDTLPPMLLKASPANNSRNFSDARIVFSFDEYVDLDNYQQNLVVSPLPENMPNVTRKLNTITVKLRDSLQPNTTYSLNFGRSVKDINEGNVMKDFIYTVSTGRFIDSLEFGGRVLVAETGEADSTLTVVLHTSSEDSAVSNQRPRYIARTDGSGHFLFRNLPRDTFYVYALKDAGISYRYLSRTQLFAFADAPVIAGQSDSVILYAYAAEKERPAAAGQAPGAARNARAVEKRLKFGINLKGSRQDLLEKFIFTFETPLRSFDSSKIHISTDSTYTPVTGGYNWLLDSTRKKLSLNYEWRENTLYHLVLEKDFATDTLGQQLLKTDTLNFTTKQKSDYGRLSIRFRNFDLSKRPVLLFLQSNEVTHSFPLTGDTFSQALFEPGEYSLRILYDTNQNGKWDPGEFFGKHKQPEIVKPLGRKLTIRANNWDNRVEMVLP
jgi:hypothetical protein